mgnify:CR=1 FL=1
MRFLGVGLAVLLADQITKHLAAAYLPPGKSVALPGHLLYLTLVRNPGAAFGLFPNGTPFLILLTCGVLGWVWFHRRAFADQPFLLKLGLTLALAGGVGNLIDRLRWGSVIDFLDVRFWPVFNVADMAIAAGVILIFWLIIRGDKSRSGS